MTTLPPDVLKLALERAESLVHRLRTGEIIGFVIVGLRPDNDAALMHGGVFDTALMVGFMEAKKQYLLQTFTTTEYNPGEHLKPAPEPVPSIGPQRSVAYCDKCQKAFGTQKDFEEHPCGPRAI